MKSIKIFYPVITVLLLKIVLVFEIDAQIEPHNRDPEYDGILQTSEYIESFDGTRLAVIVIRPTLKGQVIDEPLPVILCIRTVP